MRGWVKWWLIASVLWTIGIAVLAYQESLSRDGISSFEWGIVGTAILAPPIAAFLLGKILAALLGLDSARRGMIVKSLALIGGVVAVLFFLNSFLRYQTFNVGDGKIMQGTA
jgi:hypothetical protein